MTFEDWWCDESLSDEENRHIGYEYAKEAWEAGVREGIQRMNFLYDVCPECKELAGRHQMGCGRGR